MSEASKFRIPPSRIVFAGFSQGAGTALAAALTGPVSPAAVIMMSGFFAGFRHVIPNRVPGREMPVLICHGTQDTMLDFSLAEMCRDKLTEMGIRDITFKTYTMGHTVLPTELQDVSAYLKLHLPPTE
mmetsp:Transcript_12217/g.14030  ORF Transcript_12217/g.14030 Transcript_12217/m.14030 type:complete len:128 (-) Transcript_12217:219-602(-)